MFCVKRIGEMKQKRYCCPMHHLHYIIRPNAYVRKLRKILYIYDRTNKGMLSRIFKTWHDKAVKLDTNQLKKTFFLKTIHSSLDKNRERILRNAIYKWQRASRSITDSYDKILFKRSNLLFSLYSKWNKFPQFEIWLQS